MPNDDPIARTLTVLTITEMELLARQMDDGDVQRVAWAVTSVVDELRASGLGDEDIRQRLMDSIAGRRKRR